MPQGKKKRERDYWHPAGDRTVQRDLNKPVERFDDDLATRDSTRISYPRETARTDRIVAANAYTGRTDGDLRSLSRRKGRRR